MPTVLHYIKAPVFSAAPLMKAHLLAVPASTPPLCLLHRVLSAPIAGAHQVIDNQRNHELGACRGTLEIPVALPGSVLTSLLSGFSDRNSLILLTFVFCHGFPPSLGF
jgi:hypothetical protein